jgi:hypothetical protein
MLHILLTAVFASAPVAAPAATLTPEVLRARFGGIQSLSADVVQVKEGRYWARPFESRIRLHYTRERIVWETVAPVRSSVVIQGTRLTVTGPSGEARDLGAMGADPRVAAMIGFIRALVALDLDRIERDFRVRYGPRELVATPRASSELALFESIRMRFDEQFDPLELEVRTANERTSLRFERLERDTAASPGRR